MELASSWARSQGFHGEFPFISYWGAFHPVPEKSPSCWGKADCSGWPWSLAHWPSLPASLGATQKLSFSPANLQVEARFSKYPLSHSPGEKAARQHPPSAVTAPGDLQFGKTSSKHFSSQSQLSSDNRLDGATCWINGKSSLCPQCCHPHFL